MSTSCWIGREKDDNIIYVYCKHGGIVDDIGKTLVENYNTEEKVSELLSNGDAEYIGETIKRSKFFNRKLEPRTDIAGNYRLWSATADQPCFLWKNGEWWVSTTLWMNVEILLEKQEKGVIFHE